MADKNFKVKNNIIVNDVEIDPSSPSADQILRYNGTKFVVANSGIPTGGFEGQILSKTTDTSYDTQWIDNYADQLRVVCKNGTASQINKGTAVMAVGAAGDLIEIEPAVADGSVAVKYMLGVASENIAGDGQGYVTLVGPIKGLNTNSYAVGTILYIDPSTPGGFTSTEPTAPDVDLPLAIVIKQNSSAGEIFVRMWSQGAKLGELQDVNVSGATDGQVLTYDSVTSTWIPETAPGGGGGDTTSTYVTLTTSTTLSNERVLTAGTGVTVTDGGAGGNVTIATTAILPTIINNKGELIAGTANDTIDIVPNSVTNGQVLTVNTSAATGMSWSNVAVNYPTTVANESNTTYELSINDDGEVLTLSNSSPVTVTISVGSWRNGATIYLIQTGAGQVTVNANTGVTLNYTMLPKTRTQYSALSLIHLGSNSWILSGDMAVV